MSNTQELLSPQEGLFYAYLDKYGALKVVDKEETAREYAKFDGKVVEHFGFATLGDLMGVSE